MIEKMSLEGQCLEQPYFTVTEYLNCRKFNKRYYTVCKLVDNALLQALERQFGKAHVQYFSRFSPQAKDSFQIKNEEQVQISGVLAADLLYLVTPIKDQSQIDHFEAIIRDWMS